MLAAAFGAAEVQGLAVGTIILPYVAIIAFSALLAPMVMFILFQIRRLIR